MIRAFLAVGVLFLGTLSSLTASAEAPGKVRIGLDTTVFKFSTGWRSYDPPVDRRDDFQHVTGGIGLSSLGIIVAGAITPSIVIGVRAHASATSNDPYFGNDLAFKYGGDFLFEYIFLRGIVRPFFMFQAGIDGYADGPDDDRASTEWWAAFGGEVGGGMHLVPARSFSFDITGFAGVRGGPGGTRADVDYSHFRFSTGILFGISGWLN